jgi:hypothetical protein
LPFQCEIFVLLIFNAFVLHSERPT